MTIKMDKYFIDHKQQYKIVNSFIDHESVDNVDQPHRYKDKYQLVNFNYSTMPSLSLKSSSKMMISIAILIIIMMNVSSSLQQQQQQQQSSKLSDENHESKSLLKQIKEPIMDSNLINNYIPYKASLSLNGQKENEQIMNPEEISINQSNNENNNNNSDDDDDQQSFIDNPYPLIDLNNEQQPKASMIDYDEQEQQSEQRKPIVDYNLLFNRLDKRTQWNKFNGAWGKRVGNWNKLQSAWGKRLSASSERETRSWNNNIMKNAWGRKRTLINDLKRFYNQWNNNKNRRTPTWNKMSAAWGKKKRSIGTVTTTNWNKLRGMWGRKRSITPEETMEIISEQKQMNENKN